MFSFVRRGDSLANQPYSPFLDNQRPFFDELITGNWAHVGRLMTHE